MTTITKTVNSAPSKKKRFPGANPTTESLTRRDFFKKAASIAAAASLAGCTPPLEKQRASSKKVQLVYQDWRTDWFPSMAQRMLDDFQSTHPNIRVYYSLDPPSEAFNEKMIADFKSGTAPDVFQGCCSYFPIWEQEGYTLDLRPFISDIEQATIDDWDPIQYRAFHTHSGKLFGLPKYHGALGLYYNKELFDRCHIDYPDETWNSDDYLAAMLAFREKQKGESLKFWGSMLDMSWDRLQVHANAWGGNFVDPLDATQSMMADQPALRALEWLRARMQDDQVMATPMDVQKLNLVNAFLAGKLAMIEDGSWALKAILSNARFQFGVAPFPAGPARKVTLTTTDGFGIYAGTQNPEAAWELLKFLTSKEYGREMAKIHFLQPARASLVEEWIHFIQSDYPDKTKNLNLAAFADSHQKGYSVVAEVFKNQQAAQYLANQAWQKILVLGQAPVNWMQTVSLQIEQAQNTG
jgi:multiple sugar transport system substrate-binding protein